MDLTKEQQEAYQQSLQRGTDYQVMVRSRGWEWVKKYYQSKVQVFASNLLLNEKKKIEEFEGERHELIGIKKLLGSIENDIKAVEDEQNKSVAKK